MTPQINNLIILPLGAAIPEHPGFRESLLFQLTGLVVVFIALGLIWMLLEIVGSFFKQKAKHAEQLSVATKPAAPSTAGAASSDGAEQLPAETAAVIAAAVHVYLDSGHRIDAIVPVDTHSIDWAREGRRQIHSARKVR
jgi:Na+-transporting methylmalonyl-CoA/oxaloacetate decarboxylase gamma subunit